MLIINVFIGFAMLIMGRQLFWIVISGLGFILGMTYANQYFHGSPGLILLISFGIGAIGALLSYVLQHAAAGLAGFLSGWYLTHIFVTSQNLHFGQFTMIVPIVGGIIGAILIALVLEWSLIFFSSTTGAYIIAQAINLGPKIMLATFIFLFVLGVVIQSILYIQEKNDFS